ncbi:hypothetical protein HDU82_005299 [Entophlyctis luteolus]|nr:hypothetical protein HDU82_005299 [Entophlyctis luteolus]
MRRFCVLTNGRLYLFESSAEHETLVETMRLDARSRVISMVKLDATLPLAFEVLGSGSGGVVVSWILAAPSKTSKDAWMDIFTKGVEEALSPPELTYSASRSGPMSARESGNSPPFDSLRPVRMVRQSSKVVE